jgi:N-acetylglucosaminyldiphosphoundecaprenol N-acetyl-beta-D-mannosaminyltransferase
LIERLNVLGVGISAISMADALTTIDTWIATRSQNYVCITGVHGVMESQSDPELKGIHNRAGMVTPDGMPLVWLAHLQRRTAVERVYGPDLFLEVADLSLRKGYRHFYYGGGEGVADLLASRMRGRFPGLQIVGTYTPPFRPLEDHEDDAIVAQINAADPDIVWVGLSTPKQERWMAEHIGRVKAPVFVGVGAAFDFHAGLKRQAPRWMQRSGLEWAFRFVTEPRRLAWRYLKNNPRFAVLAAAQQMGLRRYHLPGCGAPEDALGGW